MDACEAAARASLFHSKAEDYRARNMPRCAQAAYQERDRCREVAAGLVHLTPHRWIPLDGGEDDAFDDGPEFSPAGRRLAVGEEVEDWRKDANADYERDIAWGLAREQREFRRNEAITRRQRFGY